MPYINLDAFDIRILRALQEDGRLSNTDLADAVGLSASPCLRRVRRLERDGFISSYQAVLDREAVGLSLTVFLNIRLKDPSEEAARRLEESLFALPEIVACHLVSGEADYLAELCVSNIRAFEDILSRKLRNLPDIHEIRSTIALKTVKSAMPLSLAHLKRDDGSSKEQAPDC